MKRGLETYEGTLLVVSHNRDFLDTLVDYILEIEPGKATLHIGNYSDWLARKEGVETAVKQRPARRRGPAGRLAAPSQQAAQEPLPPQLEPKQNGEEANGRGGKKSNQQKRLEAQQRQERSDALKAVRKRMDEAERHLKDCSREIEELDKKLCKPESTKDPEFTIWLRRHSELTTDLRQFEERWLEVSEEFERVNGG